MGGMCICLSQIIRMRLLCVALLVLRRKSGGMWCVCEISVFWRSVRTRLLWGALLVLKRNQVGCDVYVEYLTWMKNKSTLIIEWIIRVLLLVWIITHSIKSTLIIHSSKSTLICKSTHIHIYIYIYIYIDIFICKTTLICKSTLMIHSHNTSTDGGEAPSNIEREIWLDVMCIRNLCL